MGLHYPSPLKPLQEQLSFLPSRVRLALFTQVAKISILSNTPMNLLLKRSMMFLYLVASGILAKVASLHSTSAPKSPTSGMSELRFKYIAGLFFSTTRRGNNIHFFLRTCTRCYQNGYSHYPALGELTI